MPSLVRAVLLALHATAFITLSQTAIYAVASPLPRLPTPYVPPPHPLGSISKSPPQSLRFMRNPTSARPAVTQSPSTTSSPSADPYSQLVNYYQVATENSRNLSAHALLVPCLLLITGVREARCTIRIHEDQRSRVPEEL